MSSFNEQFIYSMIIIFLGYLLKRMKVLKESDGDGIARVIFNLTLPALVVVTFHDFVMDYSLLLLVASAALYGGFSAFLGLAVFRNEERRSKGMLVMMMPGFNIGLFVFPLVEGIWGREGLQHFAMFDVGNAFIVYGVCYFIGSYFAGKRTQINTSTLALKMGRSIPFVTYIAVLLLCLTGMHLPEFVTDAAGIISLANMPLSLLLLGIYLNFSFEKKYIRQILKFLLAKYSAGIFIGTLLFLFLPLDDMVKFTLMIGLILPTSLSVLPYAVEFDYDRRFVGTVSNFTIIISFLLIWLIANFLI